MLFSDAAAARMVPSEPFSFAPLATNPLRSPYVSVPDMMYTKGPFGVHG